MKNVLPMNDLSQLCDNLPVKSSFLEIDIDIRSFKIIHASHVSLSINR